MKKKKLPRGKGYLQAQSSATNPSIFIIKYLYYNLKAVNDMLKTSPYGSSYNNNGKLEWGQKMSTYREDNLIPTSRLQYITNHPTTKLAQLYNDEGMIAPTWGKISESVW